MYIMYIFTDIIPFCGFYSRNEAFNWEAFIPFFFGRTAIVLMVWSSMVIASLAWCWIARGAGLTGFNDVVVVGLIEAFVSGVGDGVGLAIIWGFFCLNEKRQLFRMLSNLKWAEEVFWIFFKLFTATFTSATGARAGVAWSMLLHLMQPHVKVTASMIMAPPIAAHIYSWPIPGSPWWRSPWHPKSWWLPPGSLRCWCLSTDFLPGSEYFQETQPWLGWLKFPLTHQWWSVFLRSWFYVKISDRSGGSLDWRGAWRSLS